MKSKHHRDKKGMHYMFWSRCKHIACLASALAIAALAGTTSRASGESAASPQVIVEKDGTTLPMAETEINFKYQGIIKDVLVKEGDHVKAGDLLITQDDGEDLVEWEADKSLAASDSAVKSAEAQLVGREADLKSKQADYEAKKSKYEQVLKSFNDGAGNNWEVDQAKDEMASADAAVDAAKGMIESAKAEIEKSKLDKDQARFKALHQEEHLKSMRRTAPTDAIVQAVNVEPGASADPNKGSCIVLEQIDVLKVEFRLPAMEAAKLNLGQKIRVSYDAKEWEEVTVSFKAPKAIAPMGGWQTIHMLLPNPQMKAAGQAMYIELPAEIAAMRLQNNAAAAK